MDGSRKRALPTAAVLAGAVLLAGCSALRPGPAAPAASPSGGLSTTALSVSANLQQDYERVVAQVLPSVVQITTGRDLGSGIVYDRAGDIVTNAHVVGGEHTFKVTLATGTGTLDATLVGTAPADDLAVVRLKHPPGNLRAAVFADSARVRVGQITLAMGNPLGLFSSVTEGIVSAVGRTVSESQNPDSSDSTADSGSSDSTAAAGSPGATIPDLVQTSAAINPGNSGGALVDLAGRVIGIPTLAATDPDVSDSAAPGIGFAIPAATVTNIAGQLVAHGRVTQSGRAALGVIARTVLGADLQPEGAAVVSVTRDGAAERAGIAAGDIITAVAGNRITTVESLSAALAAFSPGQKTQVGYTRGGAAKTVEVTLGRL